MSLTCQACGSSNPANSEFCDACGCELESVSTSTPTVVASAQTVLPTAPISSPSYSTPTPYSAPISTELPPQTSYTNLSQSTVQSTPYTASAASTAKLISKQSGAPISEFNLEANNIIGRFDSDTGPVEIDLEGFPGDDTISRNHSEIYSEAGQWKIKDLGSTNGVFIKAINETRFGPRITMPTALNNGDEISLGKVRLLFQSP